MTIGIYILIILALGYVSVYLREGYLDLKWLKPFTWLGIFIHEASHALACVITGGRVTGFSVTAHEGYVTHYRPKVPVIGPMVTAVAPLLFGLIIMGILNHFWLKNSFNIDTANVWQNLWGIISGLNPLTWTAWIFILIFLNIGVMMGPSIEDLKSIWPLVLFSFFIHSESLAQILALVISMMIMNILLFLAIIIIRIIIIRRKNRLQYVS